MKIRYTGKIEYKILPGHIDRCCDKDWTPDKIYTFQDTYTFEYGYYSTDEIRSYIKHDLALVAGGGYDSKHIDIVSFEIKQS